MKFESQLLGATVYPWANGTSGYIFFYEGIFSQWADGTFYCTSLKQEVNCAEQAMMLHKAKTFKDQETYDAILETKSPREQKALGRMVKGFDATTWSNVGFALVTSINVDKFGQSKAWKEMLFMTSPHVLVEASPTDRIWGIGMGVDNPDLLNRNKWGDNLLGKALCQARGILLAENFHKIS